MNKRLINTSSGSNISTGQPNFFKDGSDIAYYKFNGNINDENGVYNLNLIRGSLDYRSGVYSQAVAPLVDNTDVYLPTGQIYPSIQTVSMWLKANSIPNDDCRIFGYNIRRETRIEPALSTSDGEFRIGSSNTLSTGSFIHIILTVLNSTLFVYYNESIVYTRSVSSNCTFSTSGFNQNIYSGSMPIFECDNVRLFSRGVTQEEVNLLYNNE